MGVSRFLLLFGKEEGKDTHRWPGTAVKAAQHTATKSNFCSCRCWTLAGIRGRLPAATAEGRGPVESEGAAEIQGPDSKHEAPGRLLIKAHFQN